MEPEPAFTSRSSAVKSTSLSEIERIYQLLTYKLPLSMYACDLIFLMIYRPSWLSIFAELKIIASLFNFDV